MAMTQPDTLGQTKDNVLAVDLDGTLHSGDLAVICVRQLLARRPWEILRVLWWLRAGRLTLKQKLAQQVQPDMGKLDWNAQLIEFLRAEVAKGRTLAFASAAVMPLAKAAAEHLAAKHQVKFDHVLGSSETVNLLGARKAQALQDLCDQLGVGFDYVGDSETQDPPVFAMAEVCHFVDPTPQLLAKFQTGASMVFKTTDKWWVKCVKRLLHLMQARAPS